MNANLLITGAAGGVGRHLTALLRRLRGARLIGLGRGPRPSLPLDAYLACDLTDAEATRHAIQQAQPDLVFHLAGRNGFAPPEELERVNVGGFVNLSAALRSTGRAARMIVIGSAAEIGLAGAARSPVSEDAVCSPETPYGQSKLRVTQLALAEPSASGVQMLVARPFNLLGPGLDRRLAFGAFAEQLAAVARGEARSVRCGRLDVRRDFLDVRDAARALVLLAEFGRPGQIYHVCAGRSWEIGALLERMIGLSGLRAPLEVDPARFRPADVPDIYGDPTRLIATTGWRPLATPEESLADMLAEAGVARRAAAA